MEIFFIKVVARKFEILFTLNVFFQVDQHLQPTVEWFKDTEKIDTDSERVIVHANHSMTILGALEEDVGEYR